MLQLLLRRNDDNMETFHIETCDNKSISRDNAANKRC